MHRDMNALSRLWVMGLALGCGGKFTPPEAPGVKISSGLSRLTDAPADSVFEATISGNTFALYHQLKQPNENLFYSPHSVQMALAILYGGSSGESAKAFEAMFGISSANDFHQSMNQLDRALASRGSKSRGAAGEPFALNVVNQLFVEQRLTLAHLDRVVRFDGSPDRSISFRVASRSGSRQKR